MASLHSASPCARALILALLVCHALVLSAQAQLTFSPSVGRLFIVPNVPFAMAFDAAGELFVTTPGSSDVVLKLNAQLQLVQTINATTLTGLQYPEAVVVIGSSLFVGDYLTSTLYQLNLTTGALLATHDLTVAGITALNDMVAAPDGRSLYLLDFSLEEPLRQVALNGTLLRTFNTSQYYSNDGGQYVDLTIDAAGNLYLTLISVSPYTYNSNTYYTDSGPGVLVVLNNAGALLRSFPIPVGQYNAPYPLGVAVLPDGSAIFVVDEDNAALLSYTANGTLRWNVSTDLNGRVSSPSRAVIDPTGTGLYVSDSANSRIDRFSTATGAALATYRVAAAAVREPEGLAWNPFTNTLLVSDIGLGSVVIVAANGTQLGTLQLGAPAQGPSSADLPSSLGVDAAGFIYVFDGGVGALNKFSPNGSLVQSFTTTNPALVNYGGWGLVVTSNGDVWAPDQVNYRVVHWAANGTLLSTYNQTWFGSTTFQPLAIAQLPNSNFVVTDRSGYVWTFTTAGQIVGRFNLSQTLKWSPRAIAVGTASNGQTLLFVCDTTNGGVLSGSPAIRVLTTGGVLLRTLNQSSPALAFPLGLALSPAGDLYVSDDLTDVVVFPNVLAVTATPGVRGDPQFVGLLGQSFQVHGISGSVYALLSSPSVQVNARFVFLDGGECPPASILTTQCWSHPGSYLGAVSVQERVAGVEAVQQLVLESGPASKGFSAARLNGRLLTVDERVQVGDSFRVHVESLYRVSVQTSQFSLVLDNSDRFINQQLATLVPLTTLASQRVHGLLGQTHSRRRHSGGAVEHIEGDVDDYTVSDLLASDCKFDRFGSTAAQ